MKKLYYFTVVREYEGYWYGDRPPNDGDIPDMLRQGLEDDGDEHFSNDLYEVTQPPPPSVARELVFGTDEDITVGDAWEAGQSAPRAEESVKTDG